jgi:hypothetical protein
MNRAEQVRDAFATIKSLGDAKATDEFAGVALRAEGTDFLDPRTATYKRAADFWRDNELVGKIGKRAKAMRDAKEKLAAKETAATGNPAAAMNGSTRQSGDLAKIADGILQNALNALIRALHGNLDRLENDKEYRELVLGALTTCENEISVEIPALLRADDKPQD